MKITRNCVNRSIAFRASPSCSFFSSSTCVFSTCLFVDKNRPPGSVFGGTPFCLRQVELAGDLKTDAALSQQRPASLDQRRATLSHVGVSCILFSACPFLSSYQSRYYKLVHLVPVGMTGNLFCYFSLLCVVYRYLELWGKAMAKCGVF